MEADFWNENAGENALAQLISFQKSEQNCDCLHNYIKLPTKCIDHLNSL